MSVSHQISRRSILLCLVICASLTTRPSVAQTPVVSASADLRRLPPIDDEIASGETLEQLWGVALHNDRLLQAQQHQLDAANHQWNTARAARFPLVHITTNYGVRSDEPSFVTTGPLGTSTSPYAQDENLSLVSYADLPIYTSGLISNNVARASSHVSERELRKQQGILDTKMSVAEAYVQVLRAEKDLMVARSTIESLAAHVRDIEALHKHGRESLHDLLAARVAHIDAQQLGIQASNNLESHCAGLNRRLGRPLDTSVRLVSLDPPAGDDNLRELTSRALEDRFELTQLDLQVEQLQRQASALQAGSRPQVSLRGEYGYQENRFQTPQSLAALGITVAWTPYSGGRVRSEVASLESQALAVIQRREDLQSRIALEVKQNWLKLRQTRQRLVVTESALEHAEENLRINRVRYSLGSGTNSDVLHAEALRERSRRNHLHAKFDSLVAKLRLSRATNSL